MGFLRSLLRPRVTDPGERLRAKYKSFRRLLSTNNEMLERIASLEGAIAAGVGLPPGELRAFAGEMRDLADAMVEDVNVIADGRYRGLHSNVQRIHEGIEEALRAVRGTPVTRACIPLDAVSRELVDAVGGKTANLGEVRNAIGLPVPPGFAVSAFAYRLFVEGSGIQERLTEQWNAIDWDDLRSVHRAAAAMREAVLEAQIPQDVRESITLAAHDLYREAPGRPKISLRSSAIGEDSHASFAGQYASFLNVPLEQVLRRWQETVAGKFSPRALFYMHTKGFREEQLAMAVGCFLMVDAAAAGVAYSVDPANGALDTMLISGVWGLGKPIVDGTATPDLFFVPRQAGRGDTRTVVAHKRWRLIAGPQEGVLQQDVPEELRDVPCLTPEQVATLAEYLQAIETHYRAPQDVEWALDRRGRLFILQARPLRLVDPADVGDVEAEVTQGAATLLEGGVTACPGVGAGTVVRAETDDELSDFPAGGVLVARQTSPRFVKIMTRAAAIVTEVGSVTGHMASLAREYRVPTITGLVGALRLPAGAEVTVDASRTRIFAGRVEGLLALGRGREEERHDLPSLALLERVTLRIAHLNLTDPAKNSFRAKNCRTYHDVIRFCHEMAISEMFSINDYRNLREKGAAFRLETDIPLGIYVIDLGGGVSPPPGVRTVKPEEISSVPMRALWRGMTTPGVRWSGARPIDVRGFLSVWANTMVDASRTERGLGDNSYAMVGSHYVNFGSRLGYHFTTLEAVCSENVHENYVIFRFKGGAADIERRERRVRFIAEVMHRNGFEVDRRQDLLNAWVRKLPATDIEERLAMLGRLMGCARQLDVAMDNEATVANCVGAFCAGDYAFFEFNHLNGGVPS